VWLDSKDKHNVMIDISLHPSHCAENSDKSTKHTDSAGSGFTIIL